MGQTSIALGTKTDSYELPVPRGAEGPEPRCSPSATTRPDRMVQITYAISGKGLEPVTVTRGYLYSVRVRFVGDATARQGRGGARYHAPLRGARARAGRRAPGRPGRRCRFRPGQYEYRLAIQQGEEAGVVLPRDTVRVGQPDVRGAGPQRPRARQPLHQPLLAPDRAGHRRCSIRSRPSSGATRWSSTTRSRDCSAGTPYDGADRGRKQGGGGGVFRKIFGGGGAATQPQVRRSRPRFPVEPLTAGLQARPAQAGELHAGGGGGRRAGPDGPARSRPSRWSGKTSAGSGG